MFEFLVLIILSQVSLKIQTQSAFMLETYTLSYMLCESKIVYPIS